MFLAEVCSKIISIFRTIDLIADYVPSGHMLKGTNSQAKDIRDLFAKQYGAEYFMGLKKSVMQDNFDKLARQSE